MFFHCLPWIAGRSKSLLAIVTLMGYTSMYLSAQQAGCTTPGQPTVSLDAPAANSAFISGHACNVDLSRIKIVIYALTNQWYVQPLADAPFTNIAGDGSWKSTTSPWSKLVVLLVDPVTFTPMATSIDNPALDARILASSMYPEGPTNVTFSGRTWGIKVTGNALGNQFDPGPNYWSNSASGVRVASDGLHLKISQTEGIWQSAEVYLTASLGYGTYTMQIGSSLDHLDRNTVAAPLFLYAGINREFDNEYSGVGGLIPSPYTSQFVLQPFSTPGNRVLYLQPATSGFTSQVEWAADHIAFRTWNGWAIEPAPGDVIQQWTYTGPSIPSVGGDRVRASIWLLNGTAPTSGSGDELVLRSFAFEPPPPSIAIGGIVPAYSSSGTIQSGEWISIYGANLAASAEAWKGDFPTVLNKTSVTVAGVPGYLSFVSAQQINLQVPDGTPLGAAPVVVTTASGTVTGTVTVTRVAPSLFLLDDRHVAGVILRKDGSGAYGGGTYDILGPTGSSLGYKTVAAKEGEIVALFGTGLGPTNPNVPSGHSFSGAAPATDPVDVLIGNQTAATSFAGLSGAGQSQINITIPALGRAGDYPVIVRVGGFQTQSGVVLPIQ